MRTAAAVWAGVLRASTCPNAVQLLGPSLLLVSAGRSSAHQHRRSLHLSSALSAKSMLHKFTTKSKKKFWHNGPSFPRHDDKPQGLMSLIKIQQTENRRNNPRIKIVNSILYRGLTDLLNSAEVSEEVFDLQIELLKVSVTEDFSVCRGYWAPSGDKETDAKIETVLQKHVHHFRHLLITHRVLGNVPGIVFVKDQRAAKIQEIENLLATIDFGNDEPTDESSDISRNLDSTPVAELLPPSASSMFGIDHIEFNKKIAEYKKRMNVTPIENEAPEFLQQQREQLALIKKQKLLKKKLKMRKWAEHDNVNPKDYLLASFNELHSDEAEYNAELEEYIIEEEDDDEK